MAPLYGMAAGIAAILIYWPGVVGIVPGLEYASQVKPLHVGDFLHRRLVVSAPAAGVPPRLRGG